MIEFWDRGGMKGRTESEFLAENAHIEGVFTQRNDYLRV